MHKIKGYKESFFWVFGSFLLSPYFYFRIFLRKRKKQDKLKILVIQTGKIGDLVCTTPVFREIKEKYPNCYLGAVILSRAKGILENNHRVDEINLLDEARYQGILGKLKLIKKIRQTNYNWCISTLPDAFNNIAGFWSWIPGRVVTISSAMGKTAQILSFFNKYRLKYKKHTLVLRHYLNLLKFLGIKEFSEKKEIFITSEAERKVFQFFQKYSLDKEKDFLIGISATAGNKFKEWDKKKFAQLADLLIKELNAKIIFIGSAKDKNIISSVCSMMREEVVDSSGYFNMAELPALLKYLKLFISVDTGPLYIANAMGTPVIDIVGPVDINAQPPLGDKCEIVQKKIKCAPCSFVIPAAHFCKNGHLKCIKDIETEDVFQAVKKLISRYKICH